VGERIEAAAGRHDHELAASEGKGLGEGAQSRKLGEAVVGVVQVVDDKDGERPVAIGLLPREVVEGADVGREAARRLMLAKARLAEEVVNPKLEVVGNAGDRLVGR
jgi:hypothetical protein